MFFKLFDQGNLLQCCLLHRYIDKIRFDALKKYIRVYVPPSMKRKGQVKKEEKEEGCPYSLEEFINNMRFNDMEEGIKFLTYCGVKIQVFDNNNFVGKLT